MDARASALALPTCRIAETHLAQTASARVDVARFRIVKQCKLQSSQRFFYIECPIRFVKTFVSTKVKEIRHLYY